MTTYAELRARKKPRTVDVEIVLDDEWGKACAETQATVERLERESASTLGPNGRAVQESLVEVSETLEKLLAEKDDMVAVFRFKAIPNDRYEALIAAHPPSKPQRTEAAAKGLGPVQWDTAGFQPALVHACLVEPELSAEDVWQLFHGDDAWSTGELGALFGAAMSATLDRHRLA